MKRRQRDSSAVGKLKTKAMPERDRAWFERKVAELKAELDRLRTDRQQQLKRELKKGSE